MIEGLQRAKSSTSGLRKRDRVASSGFLLEEAPAAPSSFLTWFVRNFPPERPRSSPRQTRWRVLQQETQNSGMLIRVSQLVSGSRFGSSLNREFSGNLRGDSIEGVVGEPMTRSEGCRGFSFHADSVSRQPYRHTRTQRHYNYCIHTDRMCTCQNCIQAVAACSRQSRQSTTTVEHLCLLELRASQQDVPLQLVLDWI